MKKLSILVADDHMLLRQAWRIVLNSQPEIEVVGEANNGKEVVEKALLLKPDIVLMDIGLPLMDGITATLHITQKLPQVKVLGLSAYTQPSYARKMIQVGAAGYLTKNVTALEMIKAIEEIKNGRKYICNEIKENLSQQVFSEADDQPNINCLSHRELEIVELIRDGLSSKEIADKLFITPKTAEAHRYNILRKLKMKNTAALVNFINSQAQFV
ncbi:DNA-binding response regulator, NarL/FixJ family, contains REC and HTH domains [Cnuella takakiae]|uniref:DNA-binding response regulator, NarL/FixJ family, contains REC and HTH domains n=1 Tax=Cnuella takakiae TaxID=1302690 RepID=A0A1M4WXL1_9BACT|nr:response regulator transcription factor [Cnuella takakiae]OLY91595.1 DNA-binding response regulator [Cnuella takakiae]SHE85793.1 DNA-binding response regulator, NarL/FixJ family, contains REC and HTH domains [Cnuella takakiae]